MRVSEVRHTSLDRIPSLADLHSANGNGALGGTPVQMMCSCISCQYLAIVTARK